MTRNELIAFALETAGIEIKPQTGEAWVPVNSFMAGEVRDINEADIIKLVNATIKLCHQSAQMAFNESISDAYMVAAVFKTLPIQ